MLQDYDAPPFEQSFTQTSRQPITELKGWHQHFAALVKIAILELHFHVAGMRQRWVSHVALAYTLDKP